MSKKNQRKLTPKSKSTPKRNSPVPRAANAPAAKVETPVAAPVAAPVAVAPITPVTPAIDVEAIVARLRDTYAERAVEAVEALANVGNAQAISALIEVLQNVDGYFHIVTRSASAMALGKIGSGEAIDALLIASSDAVAEVSAEAILALGQLKAAAAVPALIDIVQNHNGFYLNVTRHAAIRSLGRIGDASARQILASVTTNGWEDPAIVAAANEALRHI